ncbi:MAG TPA: DUF3037 domain-containing protein [Thermomicrobiales bacterium]|nr:DUF3037 domain-containing protein [Thermomicrobiales bacterium]
MSATTFLRLTPYASPRLPQPERFGWLTAPASTVVQPGPVHAGLCRDPAAELDHLFRRMVGTEGVEGRR